MPLIANTPILARPACAFELVAAGRALQARTPRETLLSYHCRIEVGAFARPALPYRASELWASTARWPAAIHSPLARPEARPTALTDMRSLYPAASPIKA